MDRRPDHDDIPAPHTGSALKNALQPGRGDTAIGDDPRSGGLLEITQLWANSILSVRHFGPSGRAITLSDTPSKKRTRLSGVLMCVFLLGVGGLGIRHFTLTSPPEISAEDQALIYLWTAQQDASRLDPQLPPQTSSPSTQVARIDEPRVTPLADWEGRIQRTLEQQFEREQTAMGRGLTERRLLHMPAFVLSEQPGWTRFVSEELLTPARTRAKSGDLPGPWRHALASIPMEPELLGAPEVARVAEDIPLGTTVRRAEDKDPWMVTSGLDPDVVTLAHEDGRRVDMPPRTALWPWQPSEAEIEAWHHLAVEAAQVLYMNAIARRSSQAICEGASRLLHFPGQQARAELQARAGWCALNQGNREDAAKALSRTQGPLDLSIDRDAQTVLLRSRVRLARLDLEDAIAAGDAQARRSSRSRAREALVALREHVVRSLQSVSELKAAARGMHDIERDELHQRQEAHVRAAGLLGLGVLLLLPFTLVIDERRGRKAESDFLVPEDVLPTNPFPFVVHDSRGHTVSVPEGSSAYLIRHGEKHTASGELQLTDGDQLVTLVGDATFVIQSVQSPRELPGGSARLDWGYLSVLAALLLVSTAFTVVLATVDPPPELSVQDSDARIVRIALHRPEPTTPAVQVPLEEPDVGEGARAPEAEGAQGEHRAQLRKARGMRVAVRRVEHNQRMVRTKGLLGAIDRLEGGIFGDDGVSQEVATAAGGLLGTQYGDQRGLGQTIRGAGNGGGCMSENCAPGLLTGLGTRTGGEGRTGNQRQAGDLGQRKESGPRVGAKDPLVLGSIDKATVDRIVKQHLPSIRACYERELGRTPTLRGKLSVKFVIGKDGGVSTVSSRNDSLKTPAVSNCVHSRFMRMTFPKPRGGGIVTVNYPLVFDAR